MRFQILVLIVLLGTGFPAFADEKDCSALFYAGQAPALTNPSSWKRRSSSAFLSIEGGAGNHGVGIGFGLDSGVLSFSLRTLPHGFELVGFSGELIRLRLHALARIARDLKFSFGLFVKRDSLAMLLDGGVASDFARRYPLRGVGNGGGKLRCNR